MQAFLKRVFGDDFSLNVENIFLGTCKKKGLNRDDRKFFLCVNAQVVSLLATLYYKRIKIEQGRLVNLLNYALSTCLCLGWNKGYKTMLGREARIFGVTGPPLRHRIRALDKASEEDWAYFGDRIWNSTFDLWRSSTIRGRDRDRIVWKLEKGEEGGIIECLKGIQSPCNEVRVFVPCVGPNNNRDIEEVNKLERLAQISFNQQYALSRVELDL